MASAGRILVVDDEPQIRRVVAAYLEREGYEVETAAGGEEALRKIGQLRPDLVVLDLMLPGLSGEAVCRTLRRTSDVPVIMLTAKGSEEERVAGLNLGADDYLVKPFSAKELMARVKALLRRYRRSGRAIMAEVLDFGEGKLRIDLSERRVFREGEEVALTPTEFDLLAALARQPGRVLSRQQLVDQVMGYEFEGFDETIYAHIKNLRKKVERDPARPEFIQTVYGVGYRFVVPAAPPGNEEG
ncbi:MAG: response regulator transcription factor [Bacillota bacterium]|nr:response regulator transcription factor [Bacillota bacterium]